MRGVRQKEREAERRNSSMISPEFEPPGKKERIKKWQKAVVVYSVCLHCKKVSFSLSPSSLAFIFSCALFILSSRATLMSATSLLLTSSLPYIVIFFFIFYSLSHFSPHRSLRSLSFYYSLTRRLTILLLSQSILLNLNNCNVLIHSKWGSSIGTMSFRCRQLTFQCRNEIGFRHWIGVG